MSNNTDTQCITGAIEDPDDSTLCFMPLRYYDSNEPMTTMYSWLTYQAGGGSQIYTDPFALAYSTFSDNPKLPNPDNKNQNRLNLYQPSILPYSALQWVSAIYPNASGSATGNLPPEHCPGGCAYWAHEYNLENVYMEKNSVGVLLPKYPPRKAVYAFIPLDKNNMQVGEPIKYGDPFNILVSLLDLDPTIEQNVAEKKETPDKLVRPSLGNLILLVKTSGNPYIFLGKSSSATGGTTFNYLTDGAQAVFFFKSLSSTDKTGQVVMSGDQVAMYQYGGSNKPVFWNTMPFGGPWVTDDDTKICPEVSDTGASPSDNSWMWSNRFYWQASEHLEGSLQSTLAPARYYQQWLPNSTQGFKLEENNTDGHGYMVPTGSILIFAYAGTPPALNWFLGCDTGLPLTQKKRIVCSTDKTTITTACPSKQTCNLTTGLCAPTPPGANALDSIIRIALYVLIGVIAVVILYFGYKMYQKQQAIKKLEIQSKRMGGQLPEPKVLPSPPPSTGITPPGSELTSPGITESFEVTNPDIAPPGSELTSPGITESFEVTSPAITSTNITPPGSELPSTDITSSYTTGTSGI